MLEAELLATKGDLSDMQRRLESETSRADKAYAKWEGDKASLERVKDALAAALAQVEEAEGRPIGG
jgi:hypothetical protein